MLALRFISEPEVVASLNGGRFEGDVQGFIAMDGPTYLGHALFCVAGGEVTVLDSDVQDSHCLDGLVRACVAAGENRGAARFACNPACPPLARWWAAHCAGLAAPVPMGHIFRQC